ncbi:MAG TPA: NAD(P)/FAD-dependent oxidoreductase [Actinophytocola sp.]|uniref:FAD-dependent oxidoreductase n=1 Tax=Actinophytocola sp. TaxID=1872138 RepID=UPI002DBF7249|nr:NAD(P)/FAD-dependent oxidoreductase [Actinophytocola sp.]HEU5469546.1 NAD(P)/FAD-dependent oxidoreductase [Actinophytocola sp.]
MHVLIAGAGLGGLCLAQGLRGAGISCAVYERAGDLDRANYRLHLNADGGEALRRCLPEQLHRLHLRTSRPTARRQFTLALGPDLTEVARPHLGPPNGGPRPHAAADNASLRQILRTGIEDAIRFDAPVAGYRADHSLVVLELAGGRAVSGDVLVGADGIDSAVRVARLPNLTPVDTGTWVGYGRVPLPAELAARLPDAVFDGIAAIADGTGTLLTIGAWRPEQPVAAACAELAPHARIDPTADYLTITGSLAGDDPPSEPAIAEAVRDWHPVVRELVDRIDPASFFVHRGRRLPVPPPWPAGRVTLLGDAIHATPPCFGAGANIALWGAARLAEALRRAARGETDPTTAIAGYESDLRDHVFPILRIAAGLRSPTGSR